MQEDTVPARMQHFRLRLPGVLVEAITAEAERVSRVAGHRVTVSALARAALADRFGGHRRRSPSAA